MSMEEDQEFEIPLPPPAKTLEGREEQLISAAMSLVEKRIHAGTASAQETVHFLKLGSVRNQLEQDKVKQELNVLRARAKEMEDRKSGEEMYERALNAIRGYSGQATVSVDGEYGEHDGYDSHLH